MLILGSVVLAVTGGEALYADMGHFGIRPIRVAWTFFVLPSLVLGYLGQGARILLDPSPAVIENPFFSLVPAGTFTYLLVLLSSAATVIASQALISGAFSLTRQAMVLGYLPRVTIKHTAYHTEGQIYIPGGEHPARRRMHSAGADVPRVGAAGRRVRHRGHGNDGDHLDSLLHRRAPLVGLE